MNWVNWKKQQPATHTLFSSPFFFFVSFAEIVSLHLDLKFNLPIGICCLKIEYSSEISEVSIYLRINARVCWSKTKKKRIICPIFHCFFNLVALMFCIKEFWIEHVLQKSIQNNINIYISIYTSMYTILYERSQFTVHCFYTSRLILHHLIRYAASPTCLLVVLRHCMVVLVLFVLDKNIVNS